ncbi:MAG: type IX secretion system PorP/SprF family membrane protein [Salibacteraceae bacterium]|jgi:type IX secretion system PorP/SprF family membrane protein
MKRLIVLIGVAIGSVSVTAQSTEPVLTQFYNTPLQLNPANAGLFAGRARIITNYKRQWESIGLPFQTIAASGDFQVARNVTGGDFFGFGLDVVQDKAGASELASLAANVSVSFTKAFDARKTHFVSVGFQGGYGQRSISSSGINWGNQWTNTGFNPDIYSPDQAMDESVGYFDLGAGVNYFYSQKGDNLKAYIGLAGKHLTTPTISFLGNEEEAIERKFIVNSGLNYRFGRSGNFSVFPNFVYSFQGKANALIYGTDLEYRLENGSRSTGTRKYTSFAVGLYHRWNSTLSPVVKLHKAGFSLYISYDFEVGNITRVTNGQGGMEITLKYRIGFRSGKGSRNINNAFI